MALAQTPRHPRRPCHRRRPPGKRYDGGLPGKAPGFTSLTARLMIAWPAEECSPRSSTAWSCSNRQRTIGRHTRQKAAQNGIQSSIIHMCNAHASETVGKRHCLSGIWCLRGYDGGGGGGRWVVGGVFHAP